MAGELEDEWEYKPLIDTYKYTFQYLNETDPIIDRGILRVYGLHEEDRLQDALRKAEEYGRAI